MLDQTNLEFNMNTNTIINHCVNCVEQLICVIFNTETNYKIRIELLKKFKIRIDKLFDECIINISDRRDNNKE